MPDAQNPAARAFALLRLRQLVKSGLLAGMPTNMSDPTAAWRGLSQGLGSDAARLAQFQGGGAHAPIFDPGTAGAQAGLAAHNAAAGLAPQAPELVSEHGAHQMIAKASPRAQLGAMAAAKAVARTMQHLRQLRPYGGPH